MVDDSEIVKTRTNIKKSDLDSLNDIIKPVSPSSNISKTNFNIPVYLSNESNPVNYTISLDNSKYFQLYSKSAMQLIDIACRVHDNMVYPLERIKGIIKNMEGRTLDDKGSNFLKNCKDYLVTHANTKLNLGDGTCKHSTDMMGNIVEEEINKDEKQIYWISAVLPTIYSRHAILLAFNKLGEWMALEGKTIIDEYNVYDRLFLSPNKLKEKFPQNII